MTVLSPRMIGISVKKLLLENEEQEHWISEQNLKLSGARDLLCWQTLSSSILLMLIGRMRKEKLLLQVFTRWHLYIESAIYSNLSYASKKDLLLRRAQPDQMQKRRNIFKSLIQNVGHVNSMQRLRIRETSGLKRSTICQHLWGLLPCMESSTNKVA